LLHKCKPNFGLENEVLHRVTLTKGSYLGVHKVTRGQYAQFVKATGYRTQAEREGGANVLIRLAWIMDPKANWLTPGFEQTDDHPVVCISWNDAVAFADWLTAQDRQGHRYRLPTEAEWEYACRAGTTTAYCSGNDLGDLKKVGWCSYSGQVGSAGGTKPVGQFQANGWGLYGMHGNAWEWCQDCYGEYPRGDQVDPEGPARGSDRVARGGGWANSPQDCRSAIRHYSVPGFRLHYLGCRLVMVPSGLSTEGRGPAAAMANQGETKPPARRPGEVITNSLGMRFASIPPGSFLMGSPPGEEGRASFELQHEVTLTRGLYLGVHEVTQGQWKRVMGGNPSHFSSSGGGKRNVKGLDTNDFPVESVTWYDAEAFCKQLSGLPEEKRMERAYRLPAEAEWEYACRGNAPSYQVFGFGNSLSSTQANVDNNLRRTCKVGSYQPNGFGLFDMHGNVWEWCADWCGENYYRNSPRQDPQGPATGSDRVIRGGSCLEPPSRCRSAFHGGYVAGYSLNCIGFRVALSIRRPTGGAEANSPAGDQEALTTRKPR
jgi:formylglycine-generating enzyme required for sulfatase activity